MAINLVESLPMMPLVPQIIKSFAESEDTFDLPGFVESIKHEPTVSAKLLGYANSAAFRAGREVISVQDAVVRLGLVQTKSIVLALVMNSRFDTKQCPAFRPDIFWYNTMMKARYARCILPFIPQPELLEEEQAYCFSLVADLGLLLLVSQYPDELNNLLCDANSEATLSHGIQTLFGGNDHYFYSGQLLDFWGLPESYVETVSHISNATYSGQYLNQVSLLRMAHHLFGQLYDGDDETTTEIVAYGIALNQSNLDKATDCMNSQKKFIKSMSEHMTR